MPVFLAEKLWSKVKFKINKKKKCWKMSQHLFKNVHWLQAYESCNAVSNSGLSSGSGFAQLSHHSRPLPASATSPRLCALHWKTTEKAFITRVAERWQLYRSTEQTSFVLTTGWLWFYHLTKMRSVLPLQKCSELGIFCQFTGLRTKTCRKYNDVERPTKSTRQRPLSSPEVRLW